MKALILDTSQSEGFVLLSGFEADHLPTTLASKEFLPCAAKLLEEGRKELNFIAVGMGPGSYTGTRSSVAFAQALAFSLDIPLIGFYSPLAYLPKGAGSFAVCIRGQLDETCILTGLKSDEAILTHGDPRMIGKDHLTQALHGIELIAHLPSSTPLNTQALVPYLNRRFEERTFDTAMVYTPAS